MDLDISPDGRSIVFDILGDIYTLPVTGGEAKQLTRGLAYNSRPTWSPDGKYIAFISDRSGGRHLTILNADGTCPRTIDGTDEQIPPPHILGTDQSKKPLWLWNGNFISIGMDLYRFSGGKYSLPLKGRKEDIQFSSDGKLGYYQDEQGIHKLFLHSGADSLLTKLPKGCINVQVSPDAHWLTYITTNAQLSRLQLRNLVTGEDRKLADSLEQHRIFSEHYSFTPDSRSVIIGFGGKIHRIDLSSAADFIIPFKAQVNVDLGSLDYHTFAVTHDSIHVAYTRSANSSPDSSCLVFSALGRLYTMHLPDGRPKALIKQAAGQFDPIYSSDGTWIAYVTWNDAKGGYLWRVPAGGGKAQKLTTVPAYYQYPAWSPDGTLIAVLKQDPGKIGLGSFGQLQIVPISGGQPRTIADSVPGQNEISFSSDGKQVFFMQDARHADRQRRPVPQLYAVQLDGSHEKVLAISNSRSLYSYFEQMSLSPNGRYIVFRVRDDLYLAPTTGLEIPMDILDYQQDLPPIRFALGGVDPHWEQGGDVITWSYGNQFYRMQTAKILQQASKNAYPVPDQIFHIDLHACAGYAHGTIALHNVRIITMHGDQVIEHGTVIVKDGRFTELGTSEQVKIPREARILDLSGKTIIPGLIDLHDHFNIEVDVFPQQSWKYLVNLAYGVTTARDPSTNYESFGLMELLETGQMVGPRLYSVGAPVTEDFDLKSLDDAREVVRKRALMGAVAIKQYTQETRLQKQWLLMASSDAGLNMTNEGEHYDPRNYFPMLKDGSTGIEHNDPSTWGNVFADVTTLLAESGTWLTPTLLVEADDGFPYFADYFRKHPDQKLPRFWPHDVQEHFSKLPLPKDSLHPDFMDLSATDARFRHNGVKVTMGSHGNLAGIGAQFELWAIQLGGLTNIEALQSATIYAAEGLGLQQDLGSIEPGKIADLIVLDRNPLEDIHNTMSIRFVMKDGQLFDGNTLDAIWPQKKKCPVALGLKGSAAETFR